MGANWAGLSTAAVFLAGACFFRPGAASAGCVAPHTIFFAVINSMAVGACGHCAGANPAGRCPSRCALSNSSRALQRSTQNCLDSSLASLASCHILVSRQKNRGSCHADLRSWSSSVCLQIRIKLFYKCSCYSICTSWIR